MKHVVWIVCLAFMAQNTAWAGGLSKEDQEALTQTQTLLKNKTEREKALSKDPEARKADEQLNALGMSDKEKEEIYQLSSEIMEKITKETNGDPAKMTEILQQAQKDPEGFAKKWSPDQQKRLQGISKDVEQKRKAGNLN